MSPLLEQLVAVKPGDFAVIGDPIDHSLSPVMHNPALRGWWVQQGNDAAKTPVYHALRVLSDELPELMRHFSSIGLRGVNVTVPHKERVCEFMGRLDPFAAQIRSVNTIYKEPREMSVFSGGTGEGGDVLVGANTDGHGFERSLKEDLNFDPKDKKVLLLGAGGTASMIAPVLLKLGAQRVYLWNRSPARGRDLVAKNSQFEGKMVAVREDQLPEFSSNADLIVNSTTVGISEADGLPAYGLAFKKDQVVFDVIYHRETPFLAEARQAGARVCGGLGMLLYQGAKAFEIWTGAPAPIKIMKQALLTSMKSKGLIPVWPYVT